MAPRWLPGARAIATYRISWLRQDVVAGLVLTALLVPQGMAYAQLAGLPPITGLYTSVLCLIGYAVFGPSRILVLGPDSALGSMIAATLLPIIGANGSPAPAIALASMLALLVGAIMVISGALKLGFVADLLSKPTQIGYMNGLAVTILIGQLPKLFGFSTNASGLIDETRAFVHGLTSGKTVGAAIAVGTLSLIVILVLGRWLPRIPGVLAAVVVAIAASGAFHLGSQGVSLVGTLPQGVAPLTIPGPVSDLPLLLAGAIGIALVALTDTISTASSFAARTGQELDGNGEMIGIGTANIAAGFFPGFPGEHQRLAHRPALASAPGRVPAVGHGVRRGRAARCPGRHRCRGGAVDPHRLPPGLVAVPDHARTRTRNPCAPRPPTAPRCRTPPRPGHLPLRRAAVLRQRPHVPRGDPPPRRRRSPAAVDRDRSRADRRHRHDGGGHARGPRCRAQRQADPSRLRRAQRSGPREKLERYELLGPLDPDHFLPTTDAAVDSFCRATGAQWVPATAGDH